MSKYLSTNEAEALQIFVKKLQEKFRREVEDVRVFGSKARGEATPDSDVDILVLVNAADYQLKQAILWLAAEISLAYDLLLSPRVIPHTAWQQMKEGNTLFYRNICAEGIPLLTPEVEA